MDEIIIAFLARKGGQKGEGTPRASIAQEPSRPANE
jgi:hypothetical protein